MCLLAISKINLIGDGRVLPAANQFSLSVTQKSLSSCEIMAYLSVMITSSMVVNAVPRWVRCFVMFGFGVGRSFLCLVVRGCQNLHL